MHNIKLLRTLMILTFIGIVYSCNNKNHEPNFTELDFVEHQHLRDGDMLINEEANLLDPRWLKYHPDSFLVFLDLGSDTHIKIIDLINQNTQEIISKGKGPKELEGAWGINIHGKDIWVFGINQGKLIKLSPTSSREFEITGSLQLEHPYIMSGVMINDTNFLAINETDNINRLALYNQSGNLLKKFGSHPSEMFSNIDTEIGNEVFMASISASEDGKHAVLGCTRTDVIEIFNIADDSKITKRGPSGHNFNVEKVNSKAGAMIKFSPNFIGYSHSYANNDGFYIAYCGKRADDIRSTSDFLPNYIFQFSWDGNPIKQFEFDHPIIAFDINPKTNQLYCIDYTPAPVVRTYNLSK